MLEKYIKSSKIIELIEEGTNEDASMYKATLRVTGSPKNWSSLIRDILMCPDDDSDYLPSIRKEYYISEDNIPTFVWVLVIWGDVEEAFGELGPIMQQTYAAEKKPEPEAPKNGKPAIRKRSYRTEDGVRIVSSVPLPFKRGSRDNPGKNRTLGTRKGIGAYVSNVTTSGGL